MNYIFLANNINFQSILIVMAIVAVLAIVFGALIVLVSKVCAVKEDEKAKAIAEHLSGANCGGCGFAGCNDYAKALADGKADLSCCNVCDAENKAEIAKILNVPFVVGEKVFAVVKCAGGNLCKDTFNYVGNQDCYIKSNTPVPCKACPDGCLGGGSCLDKCDSNAITMVNGVAVIDKSLCTACKACVIACPKNLIEIIPSTAKVFVACSTKCRGKDVMSACQVGCIGCGLCAKNCPQGAITMVDNLPVIDYAKCNGCNACVDKCPKKCIKQI